MQTIYINLSYSKMDRHQNYALLYDNYRKLIRRMINLGKPTYYLWRNDFSSQEKFEAERKKYADIGFRVVTFLDGNSEANMHICMKALIKNHWNDVN